MPERTCIGCGRRASREELIRVVSRDGSVLLDAEKTAPGRGAWLCPCLKCYDRAVRRRAFNRALRLQPGLGERASDDSGFRDVFAELIGEDTSGKGSSV